MDEDKTKLLLGFYRAKVVDNKDPKMCGQVMVWIPDTMPKVDQTKGLWAMPANNAIGGLNDDGDSSHHYMGQCLIPAKGSWVWVFFEGGHPNKPFYQNALDLQNSKVLPECQIGNYQNKWVIFKSHQGRCIVISDDPEDARVEITGMKRNLSNPPVGDTSSVYTIDGNQTTILMDERSGKEKILIRSYQGDFIDLDITNRKLSISIGGDIEIKADGNLYIRSTGDMNIRSQGKLNIQSSDDLNLKTGSNLNGQAEGQVNMKSGENVNIEAGATMNNRAGGPINSDGSGIVDMGGASSPAGDAGVSVVPEPTGNRD
jgi:hypothetical protein